MKLWLTVGLLAAFALPGIAAAQSATVMTDKSDYAPGTIVTITGTGWTPGETVTLQLVESPLVDTHPVMTAVADANGNILNQDFSPDSHDIDISFTLTATGGTSGLQAQTTFTDGGVTSANITIDKSDCATNQTIFSQGDTVCASVAEVKTGGNSTSYHIQWYAPGAIVGTTAPVQDTLKTVSAPETDTDTFITSGATAKGTWTVVTCANAGTCGAPLDTKTFTVGGPAAKLVFTSTAVTVTAGACSSALTVQSRDSSGNPTNVSGTETLTASASPSTGASFYTDNICTTTVTGSNLTIPAGSNTATFYFKDTVAGSPALNVTGTGAFAASGANAATQTETVNAETARRGQTIVATLSPINRYGGGAANRPFVLTAPVLASGMLR